MPSQDNATRVEPNPDYTVAFLCFLFPPAGLIAGAVFLIGGEPRHRHTGQWAITAAAVGAVVSIALIASFLMEYPQPWFGGVGDPIRR